jgi:hypothetical protein
MAGKRVSTTKLLKWALSHAINDREAYLDSMAGCTRPEDEEWKAEARDDVKAFSELLNHRKTLKAEGELLLRACIYAESDRSAYLESAHYKRGKANQDPYVEGEADMLIQLRTLRHATWGRTQMEELVEGATTVQIEDLVKKGS